MMPSSSNLPSPITAFKDREAMEAYKATAALLELPVSFSDLKSSAGATKAGSTGTTAVTSSVASESDVIMREFHEELTNHNQHQKLFFSSNKSLIRIALFRPMGIVFEPNFVRGTRVRICDLPRHGAAASSDKLQLGDDLLSINGSMVSRLTLDEIMDVIEAADSAEEIHLVFRRYGNDDEEMKQNLTPFTTSSQVWARPLITPGSLCSSSTAFFQPPQSDDVKCANALHILPDTTATRQQHQHPSVISPRRFRSHSDPTVTSSSSFIPPSHNTIDVTTAQEMERMGLAPSILRSPSNLARSIDLLDQRLTRGSGHNTSINSNSSVTANTDPWACDEASSIPQCELTILTQLTSILFGKEEIPPTSYSTSKEFMNRLLEKASTPRRVCQHPFRKNDIVWVCRTCQSDETCVLCHTCWTRSNHEGHDVAFYHAQAGGCCDCGDPDAWDPRGFCDLHGSSCSSSSSNSIVDAAMLARTRGIVTAILDWFTQVIVKDVETTFYPTTAIFNNLNNNENTISSAARSTVDESTLQPDVLEDLNRSLIMNSATTQSSAQQHFVDFAMSGETKSFHSSLSNNNSIDSAEEDGVVEAFSPSNYESMQEEDNAGVSSSSNFHFPTSTAAATTTTATTHGNEQALEHQRQQPPPPPSILSVQAETRTMREASKAYYKKIDRLSHALGEAGRTQGGLYVILFSQDASFYSDMKESLIFRSCMSAIMDLLGLGGGIRNFGTYASYLEYISNSIKQFGELSILGTSEILSAVGIDTGVCWRDGDILKTTLVGKWILDQCSKLTSQYWNVAIKTHAQLLREQRASAILSWLGLLTRASDALCQTMAEAVSGRHHLVALLEGDLKLPRHLTKRWHALLLTLLAVPRFKMELAEAYCETYAKVTKDYARGIGVSEASSFTLSVQFLNRQTYVRELAANWVLLQRLTAALMSTLKVALCRRVRKKIIRNDDNRSSTSQQPLVLYEEVLDPNQPVLMQRRYQPCISDIKCVLNVQGMPRLFASMALFTFLQLLKLGQGMDKQVWRSWSMICVENEVRGWVGAFNCSISLGSIYERILTWHDDAFDAGNSVADCKTKPKLLTCAEICDAAWCAVLKWQQGEVAYYQSTGKSPILQAHECSSAALPYSTVHYLHGSATAQSALPVSQVEPWSFHYPLHRFFSVCLRELCRRATGSNDLASWMAKKISTPDDEYIWRTMVEFPALALSRAAQITTGLWRRNGEGMRDQVLNYAEPPFCRSLRDADFALLQFATVALNISCESNYSNTHPSDGGTAYLINLFLHRFRVFDFVGFLGAPSLNHAKYLAEIQDGLFPPESPTSTDFEDKVAYPGETGSGCLPLAFYPARGDHVASLSLLEELMNTLIILITELPSPAPVNERSQVDQAKHRLRREVIHRLVSGPKTHSELIEVQQVLPQSENSSLSEEGRRFNPNDAGGALLEITLSEVAERKPTSGFDPDQWILKKDMYAEYDPSFYHVSPRAHQSAAEYRSSCIGNVKEGNFFKHPAPYAPRPSPAHSYLRRLRRDLTADAVTVAIIYRALHIHCSNENVDDEIDQPFKDGKGKSLHELDCMSETSLARSVHLLTLAAYCWEDENHDIEWWKSGGGGAGSIFHGRTSCPGPQDWVKSVMLGSPAVIMHSDCFSREDNILTLLHRLASKGAGRGGSFVVQDAALRSGAAWLCKYAAKNDKHAAYAVEGTSTKASKSADDLQRRKQEAKERALMRMKGFQAKFADSLSPSDVASHRAGSEPSGSRASSDQESFCTDNSKTDGTEDTFMDIDTKNDTCGSLTGLLKERPRCIVCDDDENSSSQEYQNHVTKDQPDALAFCGFAQASMVLKGCGEPVQLSSVNKYSSIHVSLCGHAIHASCCDAYITRLIIASTSLRDGSVDQCKNGEFRCPMCKRLSNCLVPFVDVSSCWAESPHIHPTLEKKSDQASEGDLCVHKAYDKRRVTSLHRFLSPDSFILDNAGWDGRCNFHRLEELSIEKDAAEEGSTETSKSRRRRIQPFGKKELFSAWSMVMRSPRRKKHSPKFTSSLIHASQDLSKDQPLLGGLVVFRRLAEQLSDVAYKVDLKRINEHDLTNFGEFRHYLTEQLVYNVHGRDQLLGPIYDWPACISGEQITKEIEQDFDKEKICSQFLFSIQSFAYSCCAEAHEIRRIHQLVTKAKRRNENKLSTFGLFDVQCNGMLVVMPSPTLEDGGVHIFDGRLGKLRYLALALISASKTLSREAIQLSFSFPVRGNQISDQTNEHKPRAPIAYPILTGHALSHTVAAMCAVCGATRTVSLKSSDGDDHASCDSICDTLEVSDVISSCENFIKLGFLARILQVLLGSLEVYYSGATDQLGNNKECILDAVNAVLDARPQSFASEWDDSGWANSCAELVKIALKGNISEIKACTNESTPSKGFDIRFHDSLLASTIERFHDACLAARIAGESFLADAALVLQIVAPGALFDYRPIHDSSSSISTLEGLFRWLQIETMSEMLHSTRVRDIVSCWYSEVLKLWHDPKDPNPEINMLLMPAPEFPVCDWPLSRSRTDVFHTKESDTEDCSAEGSDAMKKLERAQALFASYPKLRHGLTSKRMLCEGSRFDGFVGAPTHITPAILSTKQLTPVAHNSSKQCVSLLGAAFSSSRYLRKWKEDCNIGDEADRKWKEAFMNTDDDALFRVPRIESLPTSYTDLYAQLSSLLPESDQTAVCLVCGTVLNSGGKGECTKHAMGCGAGCGLFFLLQECVGLILHGKKAAYVHSPYVDAHGETPQFRGRPLNLDLERYEILQEMWSNHSIRQKVMAERASARQVIIPNFY